MVKNIEKAIELFREKNKEANVYPKNALETDNGFLLTGFSVYGSTEALPGISKYYISKDEKVQKYFSMLEPIPQPGEIVKSYDHKDLRKIIRDVYEPDWREKHNLLN